MAEFEYESASSSDDEVEFDVEQFSIAGHSFDLTTVAFMPITKLLKVCVFHSAHLTRADMPA